MHLFKISLLVVLVFLLLASVTFSALEKSGQPPQLDDVLELSSTTLSRELPTHATVIVGTSTFQQETPRIESTTSANSITVPNTEKELATMETTSLTTPAFPYQLSFLSGSFTPDLGIDPAMLAITEVSTYGFIMLTGRHTVQKYQALEKLGVELLGYHTHHSVKAKIPTSALSDLISLPFVRWIGYAKPDQKLHPLLLQNTERIDEQTIRIFISLFPSDSPELDPFSPGHYGEILEEHGVTILTYLPTINTYFGETSLTTLDVLTQFDFVLAIEEETPIFNELDQSASSVGVDYIRPSYSGLGRTVGIIDTGYDDAHVDLLPLQYCTDYTSFGNSCTYDPSDHGTRVAGIIWGRGIATSAYKGMLPDLSTRKLAATDDITDWNNAFNWITSSPVPDVVSMSQGTYMGTIFSYYPCSGTEAINRDFDNIIKATNVPLVKSAGNCGPTSSITTCPGYGPQTISTPGCAKNVLTVGSITDFGTTTDLISGFSSRGPTSDGRKKPDVVAPGDVITSTSASGSYTTSQGTSFAAPHISGIISSLIQHSPAYAGNPALIKSTLASTAIPYQGNGNSIGNDYGHGKTDSYLAHYSINSSNGWISTYDGTSSVTGNTYTYYETTVPSDTNRMVIALSWIENAASALASQAVINNLDLWIDYPPYGSTCQSGEYTSNSLVDNLEYYWLNSPPSGPVRFKICNVFIDPSQDPQPFAISWHFIRGDVTPSYTLYQTLNTSQVALNERFTMTAEIDPDSYVLAGVHITPILPPDVLIDTVSIVKEDGSLFTLSSPTASQSTMDDFNLGDIIFTDTRLITWTLYATSLGQKTVGFSTDASNSGTASVTLGVNVLNPPGSFCTQNSTCSSGYCEGSQTYASRCCTSQPPTDGWNGGGNLAGCSNFNDPNSNYRDYYCTSSGAYAFETTNTFSCNSQDGWYGGGDTYFSWCGIPDNDLPSTEINYYVYSNAAFCAQQSCQIQDCNSQDGWYGGGNTPGCGADPARVYHDYYTQPNTSQCTSTTNCFGLGSHSCDNQDSCSIGLDYFVYPTNNSCTFQLTPPNTVPWTWEDDIRLTSNPAYSARPDIAIDSSGNLHLVWHDTRQGIPEIYYKKLTNHGSVIINDTSITDFSGSSAIPRIAIDSMDNLHIVWQDNRDGTSEIYYTKLNDNGNTLVDDLRLTTSPLSDEPVITIDTNDDLHVAWSDNRSGDPSGFSSFDVFYRKLDNNGTTLINDTRLTFTSSGTNYTDSPEIFSDAQGDIYILSEFHYLFFSVVYYVKLDHNGNILVPLTLLPTGGVSYPTFNLDSLGNIHLAWSELSTIPRQIFYKKVDSNGNPLLNSSQLSLSNAHSSSPSLSLDPLGNAHIVWTDTNSSTFELHYIRLNSSGFMDVNVTTLTNGSGNQAYAKIAADDAGNSHLVWQDNRDGNYEIYYKRSLISNQPPQLIPLQNEVFPENTTLSLQLVAIDPNNDPLTYSTDASTVLPTPHSFTPSTGLFSWTPGFADYGNYTVTFTASDGFLNDSIQVTLSVQDVITSWLTHSPPRIGTTVYINYIDPVHPGKLYFFAFAFDNSTGIPISDGRHFPLDNDTLFQLSSFNPPSLSISNSIAYLDATGLGIGSIPLPNDSSLVGLQVYLAGFTMDTSYPLWKSVVSITEEVPITITS